MGMTHYRKNYLRVKGDCDSFISTAPGDENQDKINT